MKKTILGVGIFTALFGSISAGTAVEPDIIAEVRSIAVALDEERSLSQDLQEVHASRHRNHDSHHHKHCDHVGPTGPQGATGAMGTTGATGATGATGIFSSAFAGAYRNVDADVDTGTDIAFQVASTANSDVIFVAPNTNFTIVTGGVYYIYANFVQGSGSTSANSPFIQVTVNNSLVSNIQPAFLSGVPASNVGASLSGITTLSANDEVRFRYLDVGGGPYSIGPSSVVIIKLSN